MEIKVSEKTAGILLIIFAVFVGGALIYSQLNFYQLNKKGKYTIGVTEKVFLVLRSGRKISYKITIQDKVYIKSSGYKKGVIIPNGRYYVRYLPSNPQFNEIYFDKPVPDDIKEAPAEGWNKIPSDYDYY